MLFQQLKKILLEIKKRYSKVSILAGGDFNANADCPNVIDQLKLYSTQSYTRWNVQGRANTKLDHFYSSEAIKPAQLANNIKTIYSLVPRDTMDRYIRGKKTLTPKVSLSIISFLCQKHKGKILNSGKLLGLKLFFLIDLSMVFIDTRLYLYINL